MDPGNEQLKMTLRKIRMTIFQKKITELLNNKFKNDKQKIKKFLINCILKTKGNIYIEESFNFIKPPRVYDFYKPESGIFLKPGNVFVKLEIKGTERTVDLANIAKWTDHSKEDKPLIGHMTKINDAMNNLSAHFSPLSAKHFEDAKKLATSMWFYVFLYTQKELEQSNRRVPLDGLLILCIFHSLRHYKFTITEIGIHNLLTKYDNMKFNFVTLNSYIDEIKKIFGRTPYESYFFAGEDFELPVNIKIAKELYLKHLKSEGYKPQLDDKAKELGIILYLADIFGYNELNLEFLILKNPSIHQAFIMRGFNEITTFYKEHKELKNAIIGLK